MPLLQEENGERQDLVDETGIEPATFPVKPGRSPRFDATGTG
jgi:hypothetical protein